MKYFLKSLPYLKPYWRMALCAILMTFAVGAIGLATPWPVSFLIDGALGKGRVPSWMARIFHRSGVSISDRYFYIYVAVFAQLAIAIIGGGLHVVSDYILTRLQQRMILDFRSDLLEQSLSLSIAYHDRRRSGMLIYIINSMGGAPVQLLMKIPFFVQNLTTLVGMFLVLLRLDHLLAFVALGVVPFLYYSVGYYATHIQQRLREVKTMEGESLAIIHEALSMIRVIFAFGRQDFEYGRFRRQGDQAVDARISVTNSQNLFTMAVGIITAIGASLVLGIGARHVLTGALTIGGLYLIVNYIAAVYKPLEAISYGIGDLQDQFMNLQIAMELLDSRSEIQDAPDAVAMPKAIGNVRFEGVDFSYTGREGTLKDISFEARAGQVVAIVGPTGAGKSSLVSLLPRFYDLTSGSIFIDEIDIRTCTLKSLREQIAIVVQEPLLFSGSIKENIRYGRLTATDEEVIEAAKAANAHDFIMALPEQYDTLLGERGAQISGGERQRLSIARAVIKDAPILILDEPTSAVDSKTESVILEALGRLMKGRTTFMIAHRLSTIRDADLILVLDKGEIVQRGTHQQLLQMGGLYSQLHQMQVGADEAPAEERAEAELKPETSVAVRHPDRIVVLGMMSRWPVGGVAWVTIQYMEGLRRLGYDVYYVEAHGCAQTKLMVNENDDGVALAAAYIERILRRFGFERRWAYHDIHAEDRCFGMSLGSLKELYRNAGLIINLHAGTYPLAEHSATGRLLYLETDPVAVQVGLYNGDKGTEDFLQAHCAYYTWGLNYGNADCRLPVFAQFPYKTTGPVVVTDFWQGSDQQIVKPADRRMFTTVGNWKQGQKEVIFRDEAYHWSKHLEFLKFLDLPAATEQRIELALAAASLDDEDATLLKAHGWALRNGDEVSGDMDEYRRYLCQSRGELTVAKDQNVRLRSGWFSERSAQYLAAGRPVIMQETGFSNALPTGEGLFSFLTKDEIVEAIDEVNSDYEKQCRAALQLAREYFNYDVVLKPIMSDMGLSS
jgi:ATP-binding cassette subfamily B protein/subfamily B ATP-binding cassette protein MsbA